MATYCICCGRAGVKWPKYMPEVCSQKCAAWSGLGLASASGPGERYCPSCGKWNCPVGCVQSIEGYSLEDAVEFGLDWGTIKGFGGMRALKFTKEADTYEELIEALEEAKAVPGVVHVRAYQVEEEGGE